MRGWLYPQVVYIAMVVVKRRVSLQSYLSFCTIRKRMVISNDIITVVHTLYNQVTHDIYAAGDSVETLKEKISELFSILEGLRR